MYGLREFDFGFFPCGGHHQQGMIVDVAFETQSSKLYDPKRRDILHTRPVKEMVHFTSGRSEAAFSARRSCHKGSSLTLLDWKEICALETDDLNPYKGDPQLGAGLCVPWCYMLKRAGYFADMIHS